MRPAVCALIATLVSASPAAIATSWTLSPRASLGSQLADNPRLAPSDSEAHERGVIGMTADAGLALTRQTEISRVTLSPAATFLRYEGQEELDADNQRLSGNASRTGERLSWKADLEAVRDTTLTSERSTTGLTEGNERHERIAVGGGPEFQFTPRLGASARVGVQFDRYAQSTPTGLADYRYRSIDERVNYQLTERTTFSARGAWAELRRDGDDDRVRDLSLSLALQRLMTERWDLTIAAGPSRTDSDRGSEEGLVFDLDNRVQWPRTELWSRVGRSVVPNGRGTLARSDRASVGVDHRLSPTFSTGVSARWNRNRDLVRFADSSAREDRYTYWQTEGHLTWAFHPEWNASFALRAQQQRTDYQAQPQIEAEGWSGNIVVTWTGQSWLPR